jgi:hypothetical protein
VADAAPDATGRSVGGLDGDAVEHLAAAAREVIGALRKMLDAAEAVIDEQVDRREREPRVRRIDVE